MKRFLLIIALILGFNINAQVGIGIDVPNDAASLEIYSKTGGVLLPRLYEDERNDDIVNPAEGLMIYNLTEHCLNIYKGSKWNSFCGDAEVAKVADLDCVLTQEEFDWATQEIDYGVTPPVPNGTSTVFEQVPLTTANTVKLTINVTDEGSLTITATTPNGYSFSYYNPLVGVGTQTIELVPSGTPKSAGTDAVTITINGEEETCKPTILVAANVDPKLFTFNCSTVVAHGRYIKDVATTGNNYLSISVTNTSATESVNYHIRTAAAVNGVTFDGSGTIAPGQTRTVNLLANGTPTAGGTHTFTLTSNSTVAGQLDCTSVQVSFEEIKRKIKIMGLGTGAYQPASAGASYAVKAILENTTNFGKDVNSKVLVDGFSLYNGGYTYGASLASLISSQDPDIIIIGYAYSTNNSSAAATINALSNFLDAGGVIIDARAENAGSSSEIASYLQRMFGTSVPLTVSGVGSETVHKLTTNNNPILNGPFMDLRNTLGTYYAGSDGVDGDVVSGLAADPNISVIAEYGSGDGRAFMAVNATRGYLWGGDEGWMAGHMTTYRTNAHFYPSFMSPLGIPAPKSYGTGATSGMVYNSYIYANAIAWAIDLVLSRKP